MGIEWLARDQGLLSPRGLLCLHGLACGNGRIARTSVFIHGANQLLELSIGRVLPQLLHHHAQLVLVLRGWSGPRVRLTNLGRGSRSARPTGASRGVRDRDGPPHDGSRAVPIQLVEGLASGAQLDRRRPSRRRPLLVHHELLRRPSARPDWALAHALLGGAPRWAARRAHRLRGPPVRASRQ